MRIAIVSDIHGNLMALDAVMTDLERQDVDEVWCGGDIAFGGPWASDCVDRVRASGWPTVCGNADFEMGGDVSNVSDPELRLKFAEVIAAHALSDDRVAWLAQLPEEHRVSDSVLLVHASPDSMFTAPQPDAPGDDFRSYEGRASLVVYGHVHKAFVRRLADGTIVCNPGSVGMPRDGETASYLLLDRVDNDWVIRFRRVPYDRRAAIAEARVAGGPIAEFFLSMVPPD